MQHKLQCTAQQHGIGLICLLQSVQAKEALSARLVVNKLKAHGMNEVLD